MIRSTFALLAAGMLVLAGSPDLLAQDAGAEETADAAADAPSDVRVVDASILGADGMGLTALHVEFSGSGDSMTAALTVPDMEGFRMQMNDLHVSEQGFTFSFLEPGGTSIDCDLMRLEDDSFRGECGTGGVPVEMTIEAFEE